MAIQARIELMGAKTHTAPARAGGRTLKYKTPIVITTPAHIEYYRSQGGISVTFLTKAKAKVAPPAPDAKGGDQDGDGMTPVMYTEAELNKMKKIELLEKADDLGLDKLGDASNADIKAAIMEAQRELLDEDGEDEDEGE